MRWRFQFRSSRASSSLNHWYYLVLCLPPRCLYFVSQDLWQPKPVDLGCLLPQAEAAECSIVFQDNSEAVESGIDHVERGRREVQEANVRKLFSESEKGPVGAQSPNCVFDESGSFIIYPWWRGIAIANIATGKVRLLIHC